MDDRKVEPGDSVAITFDKQGTYHYVCELHRHDMDGDVIVQ
jgi:plastocyanin